MSDWVEIWIAKKDMTYRHFLPNKTGFKDIRVKTGDFVRVKPMTHNAYLGII